MSTVQLTDKFKTELVKFFKWVELLNYTVSQNDIDQEWSLNLCPDFVEPGRFKLVVFIEEILKNYNIHLDETEILDAKQLVVNFKNYKPVKSSKSSKSVKSPSKRSPVKPTLVHDESLDTSTNGMMLELDLSTKQLEKIFGCKASLTGNENTDHRYEWKFVFNDEIYSIYDWAYHDNTFDDYIDNQWFLGGDTDHDIEALQKLLSPKPTTKRTTTTTTKPKPTTSKPKTSTKQEEEPLNIKSEEYVIDSDAELDTLNIKTTDLGVLTL